MHPLIAIALLSFLPPDTSPSPAHSAKPQPVTLEILEARLLDTQQVIRDQNRSLYKLAFLTEELLERLEKLEAVEKDRRRPAGLKWIPGEIYRDGSQGDGRWELIWPGSADARVHRQVQESQREDLGRQLNERMRNLSQLQPAATIKRWHPPRQNCDEDDFTDGYWE